MDTIRLRHGAVIAGWLGVTTGVADALAGFLHPVNPVTIPFAATVYGLSFIVVYHVFAAIGRLVWPARRIALAVTATAGLVPGLFGVSLIAVSVTAFMRTKAGLALGFGAVALACCFVAWCTWKLVTAAKGRHRVHGRGYTIGLIVALLVWPAAWLVSGDAFARRAIGEGEAGPRGVILVSMDAMRGDRVSALGYPRPTTPNLDRLVDGGLSFTRAYVQSPCSGPGHASMLTGLPSLVHGVVCNADVLDEEVVTVAERLRDEGFHTAAFMNNYYLEYRFGFAQGFDVFLNGRYASSVTGFLPWPSLHTLSAYHLLHRLYHRPGQRTNDSIDGALAWLRHRPDGDFFVFLHIMDPHSPYAPPPDLRDRFYEPAGDAVVDTPELRARMDDLTPVEVAALRDLYDGDIALADRKLGRLVAELERQGILDSTLLVVTGDHGEVLYEKDRTFDHGLVWEGNLVVPLVMSCPDRLPAGEIVEHPVSATGLVPTIFSVFDLDYADQAGEDFYAPLWPSRGQTDAVMTLTGLSELDYAAAIGPRYKVIARDGVIREFYDLLADPVEAHDLWPAVSEGSADPALRPRAEELSAAIDTWLARCRRSAVVDAYLHDGRVDYDTEQRLRALGY